MIWFLKNKKYNPEKYWKTRGKIYYDKFQYSKFFEKQEIALLNYLRKMNFTSILEFGCGFGRITKLILENFDVKEYHAIDISIDQIRNAKNEIGNFPTNVNFEVCNIEKTNFKNNYYDLVLGVEVLMHVQPKNIESVITKLINASKNHFVNIDFYNKSITKLAPHNFLHNYPEIFKNISSSFSIKEKPIENQMLFHVIKNNNQ